MDLNGKIEDNYNTQRKIEREIFMLQNLLAEKELEGYLLNVSLESPTIIPSDNKIGKYKYLTEPVSIDDLNIKLYPLWLSINCTHPKWSDDVMALNLIKNRYNHKEDIEILIDGMSELFYCSYSDVRNVIINNELFIPNVYSSDFVLNTNIIIDYDKSEPIDKYEQEIKNYHLRHTTDEEMMINTAKIKFILVTNT